MTDTISKHMQNSIIYLGITDDEFIRLIPQIPEEVFTSEVARISFRLLDKYYKKHSSAPKDHFHDEIVKYSEKLSPQEKETFARYIYSLRSMKSPDRSYVISRLNDFIKASALISVTYEFAELVEKQEFEKATLIMQEALRAGLEDKPESEDFLSDFSDLNTRGDRPNILVPLGIPEVDEVIGGLSPKELVLIVGGFKGFKSWFGHHIGKTALKHGLNVLHVSHENSKEMCQIRYDMMFGGLVDEKEPKDVLLKWMDGRGRIREEWEERETVYNKTAVKKARKRMAKFGGSLVIKKYAMGTCSPMELNNYINRLETFDGFYPDVVINDYADLMKSVHKGKEGRDNLNDIYIYLKQIADEKDLVMVTMSQVNREGLDASFHHGRIEMKHLAEDIRKAANIDKGFFVARPRELEEDREAVVGCIANRNKPMNAACIIGYNLDIGQFRTYSYLPNRED